MSSSTEFLSSTDGDSVDDKIENSDYLDISNELEEFVLSPNRRNLLQIENEQDIKENDSIDNDTQSLIFYGSDKHLYFHLLQIENEITNILMNNNNLNNLSSSDSGKIISLLNEADNVISKYDERKCSIEDLNIMSFRHKLRKLFLSPYIQMNQQQKENEQDDIFDIIIDKLGVTFDHQKPNDIIINERNDREQKISSTLTEFDLNSELNALFNKCKDRGDIIKFVCIVCGFLVEMLTVVMVNI